MLFHPWVALGVAAHGRVDALAHGAAELGGPELCAAGDGDGLRAGGACGQGAAQRADHRAALGRNRADRGRGGAGRRRHALRRRPRAGARPMKWLLIAIIVAATTAGEVLQAAGMRRHGEIRDFRPGALGRALAVLARNRFVIAAVAAMAVSFFAFLGLLTIADLSFAVPATAVTYVLETVLAKYVLKEHVNWLRWAGASLVICGVALVSL